MKTASICHFDAVSCAAGLCICLALVVVLLELLAKMTTFGRHVVVPLLLLMILPLMLLISFHQMVRGTVGMVVPSAALVLY